MKKEAKLPLISWAFYDFGNSAFSAIVQTFVFAAYFTKYVASDELSGSVQWGYTNSLAAIIVAIIGPILGSIVDKGGKSKLWIAFFTYLCVINTLLLWFITPPPEKALLALTLVFFGIIGSELAFVIYNAILCNLTDKDRLGKWSGWGWALGYLGGLLSLGLVFLIFNGNGSFLPTQSEKIRASFPIAAIWFMIFSLPFFLFTPGIKPVSKEEKNILKRSLSELYKTLSSLKKYKRIAIFLLARLFFINGLTTLFAFGGVIAATIFGMTTSEILLFGIALHVSAGIGAFIFSFVDDIIGGKKLILISLVGIFVPCIFLLFIRDLTYFWILVSTLGIFVGPVQASSRSFMAKIVPEKLKGEMFGFFALSGKATNFLGPLLVSLMISITGMQEAGIVVIIGLLIAGFAIMLKV